MFKFIILSIIGFYIMFKVIGFLMRTMITMMGSQAQRNFTSPQNNAYRKAGTNTHVKVDYVPEDELKKGKGYGGGEYVDYEEVK